METELHSLPLKERDDNTCIDNIIFGLFNEGKRKKFSFSIDEVCFSRKQSENSELKLSNTQLLQFQKRGKSLDSYSTASDSNQTTSVSKLSQEESEASSVDEYFNTSYQNEQFSTSESIKEKRIFLIEKVPINKETFIEKDKNRKTKLQANREAVKRFRERQKEQYERIIKENSLLKKKLSKASQEEERNFEKLFNSLIHSLTTKEFRMWLGTGEKQVRSSDYIILLKEKLEMIEKSEYDIVSNSKNFFILQKIIGLVSNVEELKSISS